MRLPLTLSLYIGRQFLVSFAGLLAVVLGIVLLLDIVELLRRAANKPLATLGKVFEMALLKLPETGQEVVPFVILFAAMYTLWRLTRSQELIVARASGVSVWQFLLPVAAAATLIGVLMTTVVNPASAILVAKFERLENRVLRGRTVAFDISDSGLWLRQPYADGHALIHAETLNVQRLVLSPVTVLFFRGEDTYVGRLDADTGQLQQGYWELRNVRLNLPQRPVDVREVYKLPTDLDLARIQDSFASPEALSFWALPHFIETLETTGFSGLRHRMHFQSLLAQPLLLCAMVLLAAVFVPRQTRRGGALPMIVGGIATGFTVYLASDIAVAFGVSGEIPVPLAAWAPAVASLMLGTAALLQREDG